MPVIVLLCSYYYQSGFLLCVVCMWDNTRVWQQYVCVLKVLHLQVCFQKQDCDCSFVAHSCPTLGISRYSPGSKGFSEALLIGCNLLFKLESQQASSLAVYKQLMQGTPILLVTTGVYLFARPAVPSHLISGPTPRRIDSSCSAGPRCKQLLSSGAFWGRGATGGIWSESWSVRGDDGGIWGSEGFPS